MIGRELSNVVNERASCRQSLDYGKGALVEDIAKKHFISYSDRVAESFVIRSLFQRSNSVLSAVAHGGLPEICELEE